VNMCVCMCARARVRERVRVRVCMHVTMSVRKPALFWRRAEANHKGHATFGQHLMMCGQQHLIAHDASDASVCRRRRGGCPRTSKI